MKELKKKFRSFYTSIVEHSKTLRILILVIITIMAIFFLIDSYLNYDLNYFVRKEIFFLLKVALVVVTGLLYHRLFGKWHIHENNVELTKMYVSEKIPRSMKVEGSRGAGKDANISGMVTTLRTYLIEQIEDEMDLIETICYPYNFKQLNSCLDDNHEALMTNNKGEFFLEFIEIVREHDCFIKQFYAKDFNTEEHIQELYTMKKDPSSGDALKYKFKYDDGISKKHFLTLLIRYSLLFIRYHYLDNYIITNQPYKETETLPAIVFSTNYINIQKTNADWVWPLVGGVIIIETETDAFYPNVGGKESAMKTGMRNFKAFFRHLLGEEAIWIGIGQKAKRTQKTLRELDDSFVSIIEMTKVYGGEKRIFFQKKAIAWQEFWEKRSLFNKSKERQSRRKSKGIQRIKRLQNKGYLYFDIKVSRSDEFTTPKQMSLKQILRYDKPIYENYTVKLCFRIRDSFGRYNSHYLEMIADKLSKKTKSQWQHLERWDMDLTMKIKHAVTMNYPVLNEILGIQKILDDIEKKRKKQEREKKKERDALEKTQEDPQES
ncbi:MAG: hypothetical protein KKE16_01145 [Firmicutes bacterium]|nr:hypothetical protein [Bacillota bacterium]